MRFCEAIENAKKIKGLENDFQNEVTVKEILENKKEGWSTESWSKMQTSLQCCGIKDITDWGNNVPDSCCKQYSPGCGKEYTEEKNEDGCLSILENKLLSNINNCIGVVIIVGIIQVTGIVLACCIVKHMD